jgi:hypothetical protein
MQGFAIDFFTEASAVRCLFRFRSSQTHDRSHLLFVDLTLVIALR